MKMVPRDTFKCKEECGFEIEPAFTGFQVTYAMNSGLNHITVVCPKCEELYHFFAVLVEDWYNHFSGMPLATLLEVRPSMDTIEVFVQQSGGITVAQADEIMELREYMRSRDVSSEFAA